ncbi:hypothetical protein ACFFGT_00655 [Mucilaginibacter angelicae]|uniref:Uncharacterized protein n=1 Tax=Mucilaginibacter angelicae TaxID=869718 RepID=A0ABV6KZ35_9SPHI
MNVFESPLFNYAVGIASTLVLFGQGFIAVFYPQRFIDRALRAHDYSEFIKRQVQKKWYRANLKICGCIAMLFGIVLFIYVISVIIKKNW